MPVAGHPRVVRRLLAALVGFWSMGGAGISAAQPALMATTQQPTAMDVLYRGEVIPAYLSQGGLVAGSGAHSEWSKAIDAIEAQAALIEARADEVRLATTQETSVGLKLRQDAGVFRVSELDPTGPAALSGSVEADDQLDAIDLIPLEGLNLFEATALLRGEPASELMLTLSRDGCSYNVTLHRCAENAISGAPRQRLSREDRLRLAASPGLSGAPGYCPLPIRTSRHLPTLSNRMTSRTRYPRHLRRAPRTLFHHMIPPPHPHPHMHTAGPSLALGSSLGSHWSSSPLHHTAQRPQQACAAAIPSYRWTVCGWPAAHLPR
jgi:hypothetical protein